MFEDSDVLRTVMIRKCLCLTIFVLVQWCKLAFSVISRKSTYLSKSHYPQRFVMRKSQWARLAIGHQACAAACQPIANRPPRDFHGRKNDVDNRFYGLTTGLTGIGLNYQVKSKAVYAIFYLAIMPKVWQQVTSNQIYVCICVFNRFIMLVWASLMLSLSSEMFCCKLGLSIIF